MEKEEEKIDEDFIVVTEEAPIDEEERLPVECV